MEGFLYDRKHFVIVLRLKWEKSNIVLCNFFFGYRKYLFPITRRSFLCTGTSHVISTLFLFFNAFSPLLSRPQRLILLKM